MINTYFNKFSHDGIPFMNDRDKGDVSNLVGSVIHITDFGFIHNSQGEYVVFIIREDPANFYFGGMALTDLCGQVDADGMRDALAAQPITLKYAVSKRNGRRYMTYEFVDPS